MSNEEWVSGAGRLQGNWEYRTSRNDGKVRATARVELSSKLNDQRWVTLVIWEPGDTARWNAANHNGEYWPERMAGTGDMVGFHGKWRVWEYNGKTYHDININAIGPMEEAIRQ